MSQEVPKSDEFHKFDQGYKDSEVLVSYKLSDLLIQLSIVIIWTEVTFVDVASFELTMPYK